MTSQTGVGATPLIIVGVVVAYLTIQALEPPASEDEAAAAQPDP
jgi:hypothetical protein